MLKKDIVSRLVHLVASKFKRTLPYDDVSALYDCFCELAASDLLARGEVSMPGVGKILVKKYRERTRRNPRTGQPIIIPERRSPVFIPSQKIKEELAIRTDHTFGFAQREGRSCG